MNRPLPAPVRVSSLWKFDRIAITMIASEFARTLRTPPALITPSAASSPPSLYYIRCTHLHIHKHLLHPRIPSQNIFTSIASSHHRPTPLSPSHSNGAHASTSISGVLSHRRRDTFQVTETLRASRVEKWICAIKQQFLDAASIKCVGLDYEFTNPR
jgi:hypothetical protein